MRRPRSPVCATSSAVRSRRRTGARPARATAAASRPARASPATPMSASTQRSRPSVSFTSSSGRATCTARPAPIGSVRTRTLVPSSEASRRNGARVPGGHLADRVVDRELGRAAGSPVLAGRVRGVGRDDLHQAAGPPEGRGGDAHVVDRAEGSWVEPVERRGHGRRAVAELVVDLPAQLIAHRHVGERRHQERRRRPWPRRSRAPVGARMLTRRGARTRPRARCG